MTARQANLLAALSLAIDDRVQAAVKAESGRGGQQPAALAILVQQDGLGIEALRSQLGLSQPATVRLVDTLVADGLARRRPGPDARSVSVSLTAAGRRGAERVLAARRAAVSVAVDALNTKQRATLEGLLETMLGAVTEGPAEADVICRLCELSVCPQTRCPVEGAAELASEELV